MPIKHYKKEINKKPSDGMHARWSEKQKFQAVALYKMVGSLRAVSQSLGIPEDTVRKWHLTDWWKTYEDEITVEARTKRSKKLDKLVDKAINIVEDRLENGDWVLTSNGAAVRKPVNAITASRILTTTIDKQVLLERLQQDSKKQETQEKTTDRLALLFAEFAKFSKAKTINGQSEGGDHPVSTGVLINAIHEEREAGLQEGTGVGAQEEAGSR